MSLHVARLHHDDHGYPKVQVQNVPVHYRSVLPLKIHAGS